MNQEGSISGLLTSKMAYMIAIVLLIISTTALSSRIEKKTNRDKLESVIEKISDIIHKAEYLPGRVRIEEEIPQIGPNYRLKISGEKKAKQIINIEITSSENLKNTLVLNRTARTENFQIEVMNPQKIILKKFEKFSLEVF